jgi:hypothetical protein
MQLEGICTVQVQKKSPAEAGQTSQGGKLSLWLEEEA